MKKKLGRPNLKDAEKRIISHRVNISESENAILKKLLIELNSGSVSNLFRTLLINYKA